MLVTNGGKQAVYNAFAALLDPGDEVLLIAPYWTTYPEAIKLAGGVPVEVMTDETTGYLATVEQLEAARTARTKVLLFVSPSNPTGAVYPPEQVEAIGAVGAPSTGCGWSPTRSTSTWSTARPRNVSIATEAPELGDRVVVLNGVAKTYAMTGWRVGWMIGPTDVVKAASNLQSHATSNVANVAQVAALAAVSGDLSAVAEMRAAFDRRRRTSSGCCARSPASSAPSRRARSTSTRRSRACSASRCAARSRRHSAELAALILDEVEVAVVPGEAFGTPGYLRLSYALGDDDLAEGVGRIAKLVADAG